MIIQVRRAVDIGTVLFAENGEIVPIVLECKVVLDESSR
jgi:hypothetical protein